MLFNKSRTIIFVQYIQFITNKTKNEKEKIEIIEKKYFFEWLISFKYKSTVVELKFNVLNYMYGFMGKGKKKLEKFRFKQKTQSFYRKFSILLVPVHMSSAVFLL